MEQHPVPQNVTTFQFRLIGDMTIKQFGYLAGGVILAYIFYKLPLPFFFTWPLTVLSAVCGFGFAFVPIEERPMDVWIASFFKNVYSPTLYVWQKTKPVSPRDTVPKEASALASSTVIVKPEMTPIGHTKQASAPLVVSGQQKPTPIASLAPKPPNATTSFRLELPSFVRGFIDKLSAKVSPSLKTDILHAPAPSAHQGSHSIIADIFANIKTPSVTGKRLDTEAQPQKNDKTKTEANTQQEQKQTESTAKITTLESSISQLNKELSEKSGDQRHISELQVRLSQVLADKEKVELELTRLKQQMTQPTQTAHVSRPAGIVSLPTQTQPSVRVMAPNVAVRAGLPKLTTFPNVVTGIVKDNLGNLLTGVLITVRDKDDIPLRALKTNKLGQFAASTPLPNGTYLVEIEDPRGNFAFDRVQITLAGSLVPAIEVTARSQKQIARDKLAHEIFGNTNV